MSDANGFFSTAAGLLFSDRRCMGIARGGTIMEEPVKSQQRDFDDNKPLFWDDGRPREQLIVVLQTEERDPGDNSDVGLRRLFIPNNGSAPGSLYRVVGDALRQAGASDLLIGGRLMVAWIGEEPSSRKGANPRKIWAAQYTPPAPGSDQYFQQPGSDTAAVSNPFTNGQPAQQQPQPQFAGQQNGPQPQPQWSQPGSPVGVQQAAGYVASADAGQPPVTPQVMPTPWANAAPQQASPAPQTQQNATAGGPGSVMQPPQNQQASPQQPTNPFAGQQTYQAPPFDPTNPFGNAPQQQEQQTQNPFA